MAGEKLQTAALSAVNQTIFTSATLTTSTNGDAIVGAEAYTSCLISATVSTVTGTSPTFDVYIQSLLPDGATWNDTIHLSQLTTAATKAFWHVPGAAAGVVVQTGALAANSAAPNWLGGKFRVRVVVAGTNPSGVIVVNANFFS